MVVNCNAMNIIDNDSHPLIINGDTERETEDQIKKCINTLLEEDSSIDRKE